MPTDKPLRPTAEFVALTIGQIETIDNRILLKVFGDMSTFEQNRFAGDITGAGKMLQQIQNDFGAPVRVASCETKSTRGFSGGVCFRWRNLIFRSDF
jgi:hypothetical protein